MNFYSHHLETISIWFNQVPTLKLLWNCSETALKPLGNRSGSEILFQSSLKDFNLIQSGTCSKTALKLHWNSSRIALKLLWNRSIVNFFFNLIQSGTCSETALKLLWNCSRIALKPLGTRWGSEIPHFQWMWILVISVCPRPSYLRQMDRLPLCDWKSKTRQSRADAHYLVVS